MARLNESSMPAESLDALKRRFVRQNREIARANSTQSLRIRTLETEVSRLLGENIALREKVINLTQDAERERMSRRLGGDVLDVKSRLDAKLAEVGGLLQELGELPQKSGGRTSRLRTSATGTEKTSPDVKNWKNAMTLGEVTSGHRMDHGPEGRLPTISEDKYYPRRTAESEEILSIKSAGHNCDSLESPDLGPPPVAHFEEEEPIKFDPKQHNTCDRDISHLTGDDTIRLPPNLQTRKKRRDSSLVRLADLSSAPEDSVQSNDGLCFGNGLRSGAKRKLSLLLDGEEANQGAAASSTEDFQFNRKKELPENTKNEKTDDQMSHPSKGKTMSAKSSGSRRALGPKSTNTDPQSPSKPAKSSVSDRIAELKRDVARQSRARQLAREKSSAPATIEQQQPLVNNTISSDGKASEILPKTPAVSDVLSPASSEPSVRAESRDTPPPGDLNPSSTGTDETGSFGRSSRRPKGAVSYVEPSLRAKMRRPTKELVDAVAVNDGRNRSTSIKIEDDPEHDTDSSAKPDRPKMRTVVVKKEDTSEEVGISADLAGSPLGAKSCGSSSFDLPVTVMTDRKRRLSSSVRPVDSTEQDGSNYPNVNDNTRIQKRSTRTTDRVTENLSNAMKQLDIYDGPSSSPRLENKPTDKSNAAQAKVHRRHSSVTGATKISASGDENSSDSVPRTSRASTARHRPNSTRTDRGFAPSNQPADPSVEVPPSGGDGKEATNFTGNSAGSRNDRAAARRRSTMV